MPAWNDYQEEVAKYFRDLGFEAQTNMNVKGARNTHAVDVLATYKHAGLDLTWVIECKHWATRISKDKILTLRAIVEDVGADKGILLTETGFQAGALQATYKSNVIARTFSALKEESATTLTRTRLLAIPERYARAHRRYWDLPKYYRIDAGLRPDVAAYGYSGSAVLSTVESLVTSTLAGVFPPRGSLLNIPVENEAAAVHWLEEMLSSLEDKLDAAERDMPAEVRLEVEQDRAGAAAPREALSPESEAMLRRLLIGE